MSFVFQMIIKLINYWAPYDASDTPTSWGEIPQQCCFLHCMVANGTCNLLRNRNWKNLKKTEVFFLGHEFPVQTLWVHNMIWGFLSHGGFPNPAWLEAGPYGFVWFPYYQGLVHVLIHHHPTIRDTYFFKWCSNSPQKGHLPSSKWNRPCQIRGWKISFHQTWFMFTLYSNLPAYQPLMILSKSIDLSAGPVSTADAIAATTRSGARGLEEPSSRESEMRTKG